MAKFEDERAMDVGESELTMRAHISSPRSSGRGLGTVTLDDNVGTDSIRIHFSQPLVVNVSERGVAITVSRAGLNDLAQVFESYGYALLKLRQIGREQESRVPPTSLDLDGSAP